MIPLRVLEEIAGRSGVAPRIEPMLPIGVRARQPPARTLLPGMLLVLADHRPVHLTRVRQALAHLPEADQRRPGVLADWKTGPHLLSCRQTERTFGLVAGALEKDKPDGTPPEILARICGELPGASIPAQFKNASTALAVDWTGLETFSRPPPRGTRDCAGPEARRGRRSGGGPGQDSELFSGYYASAATMMRDEPGPPVPELGPPDDRMLLPPRPGLRPGPGADHRRSCARRTGAERTFSTAKDPASNNITRGWCRLMGLTPLTFWLACLLLIRNQRILIAWDARQHDNARRAAAGLPPRTRRRRRKTLTDLAAAGTPP
ncbi:MAG: hypothetical protein ACRDNT_27005 [Streptosporangiaceae bacterium]